MISIDQHRERGDVVARWTVTYLHHDGVRRPFFGPSYIHSRGRKHDATEQIRALFRGAGERKLREAIGPNSLASMGAEKLLYWRGWTLVEGQ